MIDELDLIKAALIGAGGTLVLDLWAVFLVRVLHMPATNWSMVGRWIGNMPRGQFRHASMANAQSVTNETLIGWLAHYGIGISYGLLLLLFAGRSWLMHPTLLLPMIVAWVLLIAPFFIMMPGMGSGIAGAKTPNPNLTRVSSFEIGRASCRERV